MQARLEQVDLDHWMAKCYLCGCGTRWACSSCPCSNPAAPAWKRGCRARTAASAASPAPASPASAPEASSNAAASERANAFLVGSCTAQGRTDQRVSAEFGDGGARRTGRGTYRTAKGEEAEAGGGAAGGLGRVCRGVAESDSPQRPNAAHHGPRGC